MSETREQRLGQAWIVILSAMAIHGLVWLWLGMQFEKYLEGK